MPSDGSSPTAACSWPPAGRSSSCWPTGPDVSGRTLVRRVRAAALVGALGSLVALPVQAALGTGQGPGSLFDDGVLGRVLADGVGPALWLCLARSVARWSSPWTGGGWPRWRGAVAAATSFAVTGHDRVGDTALLATTADIVHLLVVATWAGGLVLLFWALRARRRRPPGRPLEPTGTPQRPPPRQDDTPSMVLRFSSMATVAVLAAGATGTALAWSEVRTLHALTSTGYGRVLMAKVAVVDPDRRPRGLQPLPPDAGARSRASRRRPCAASATRCASRPLGLVVVVGLTAVVVAMTPARTLAQGGPVEKIIQIANVGSVQVVVAPAKAGFNQMHLYTFDLDHRPGADRAVRRRRARAARRRRSGRSTAPPPAPGPPTTSSTATTCRWPGAGRSPST